MRSSGRSRCGASACLVLVVAASAACNAINSKSNSFATLAEAREAGAVVQGWVPDGLPPGSRDLREVHVPGTARRWGLLNFPPAEGDALRAILLPEEVPLGSLRCDPPGRIEWWPVALRGRLDAEQLGVTGLLAYRGRTTDLVFAVNWKQGRAYYWAEK